MAMMSTFDPYAYDHVFMPAIVSLAVLGTSSLASLVRRLPAPARGPDLRLATGYAALALQFVPMLHPVHSAYHHEDTRLVHDILLRRLRGYGSFMAPYHGFYADQAGMEGSLCVLPLDDIMRGAQNRLLRRDPRFFDRMFDQLRHGPGRPVLITDLPLESLGDVSRPYWASLAPHYRLLGDLGAFGDSLRPLIPGATTMRFVYAPADEPSLADARRTGAAVPAGTPPAAVRVRGSMGRCTPPGPGATPTRAKSFIRPGGSRRGPQGVPCHSVTGGIRQTCRCAVESIRAAPHALARNTWPPVASARSSATPHQGRPASRSRAHSPGVM